MVCGLLGGATVANPQGSETPFVHRRMETPKASLQASKLKLRCSGQGNSKGPTTHRRNGAWMFFWSILCSICNLSTEPRGCVFQIGHLIIFMQQAQMGV